MTSRAGPSGNAFLSSGLADAVAEALATGGHIDHALLVLHAQISAAGCSIDGASPPGAVPDPYRQRLLRQLVSTPARTPLGTALKLAVACRLDGHFDAAMEVRTAGIEGSHIIVSAFLDAMAQAQTLPPGARLSPH